MALVLALAACTAGEDTPAVAPTRLDTSWVAEVTRDPAAFTALVDTDRPAWVALHRNDWKAAVGSTSPAGRRAQQELSTLHTVLAQVEAQALSRLDEAWTTNGGPPAGSEWLLLAWTAAHGRGDTAGAAAIAARLPPALGPTLTALSDPALPGDHPLVVRSRLHAAVVSGAEPLGRLLTALGEPLLAEPVGGATRELWDPLAHHTLARWYGAHPHPAADAPAGLAARVFSGSLLADVAPLDTPAALGIAAVPVDRDDPQACREVVRALDTQLDGWAMGAAAGLGEDGRALLTDLRLVAVGRARLLEALAVAALPAAPGCALAYGQLALDHAESRAVTPINSPTLFAVLAAAHLATGHTREALDALEPLHSAFPEIHGLDETVGDLAILQGIHRTGDSREN